MTQTPRQQSRYRVAQLNPRQPTSFVLSPDAAAREAIAAELGLIALPALKFQGEINAARNDAWQVDGQLTAKVVQPCVITLGPVKATLSETVHRAFSPHISAPDGEDIEMSDDETDPLGAFIDIEAIMTEALVLALPLYPRAKGAALDSTEDEATAETRKPFSGLADLLRNREN